MLQKKKEGLVEDFKAMDGGYVSWNSGHNYHFIKVMLKVYWSEGCH